MRVIVHTRAVPFRCRRATIIALEDANNLSARNTACVDDVAQTNVPAYGNTPQQIWHHKQVFCVASLVGSKEAPMPSVFFVMCLFVTSLYAGNHVWATISAHAPPPASLYILFVVDTLVALASGALLLLTAFDGKK